MNIKTTPWEVQLSDQYIAGFLDGDGSVVALKVKTKQRRFDYRLKLRINFTQKKKDKFILEEIRNYFGKVGRVSDSKKYYISEYVIANKPDVKKVLIRLRPYVVIKRRQIELALKIISIFESHGRGIKRVFLTEKEYAQVMLLGKKIRNLNSSTGGKKSDK